VAKARQEKKRRSSKSRKSKPARKARTSRATKVKAPKAKKTKRASKAVKKVELKKLRVQFAGVLAALASKGSGSPDVSAKLDDTRRRISQWMTDVDDICTPELQEICGPDMVFPIP